MSFYEQVPGSTPLDTSHEISPRVASALRQIAAEFIGYIVRPVGNVIDRFMDGAGFPMPPNAEVPNPKD